MGLYLFHSRSSYDTYKCNSNASYNYTPVKNINPNPLNYKIVKHKKIGQFLIIKVNYPDCKNYEGDKILLYLNVELKDLKNQGSIDPHFSNNKTKYTPIARFVPTELGWKMAKKIANTYEDL